MCSAYGVGLWVVSLLARHLGWDLWLSVGLASGGLFILGLLAAGIMPRRWYRGPDSRGWAIATGIAVLATLNYGWQTPSPAPTDISQLLHRPAQLGKVQIIQGTVQELPSLNRSDRGRLWLKVRQVRSKDDQGQYLGAPQKVTGKLYVTADWDAVAPLYPGQTVELEGRLYQPGLPKNPNSFDFRAYLADRGTFAGVTADTVTPDTSNPAPRWRLWQLRRRIAQAQAASLGTPAGPLVSAMALGRRAVNIPYDIQDAFIQAGLAHTLAASGFHVSLVLGLVLGLLKSRSGHTKLVAGAVALVIYVGLTGAQPSVMRASLMGAGALIGLALDRKVNPLGCLLVAVTLLLVWQPTWIDDIGFRLSVMATLGLVVTATPLTQRLDWLPPAIATLVAVPLAAYLWTIPLQLYYFNTLSTYSIVLNMVVTPLVTLLSLGGILTGLVAAIAPPLGELLAWPLYFPAHALIWLVNWETNLPGNSLAIGHISLAQMLGLYGLLLLGWLLPWCQRRRWVPAVVACGVAIAPLGYQTMTHYQITVLAAGKAPVLVAQDYRQTLLISSGDEKTAFYTVNPFLKQAGVNGLAWAVGLPHDPAAAWQIISDQTPVEQFFSFQAAAPEGTGLGRFNPLQTRQAVPLGHSQITRLGAENPIFQLVPHQARPWLMLPPLSLDLQRYLSQVSPDLASAVLWWDGSPLADELLDSVKPEVAIASNYAVTPETEAQLSDRHIQLFLTERDGAVTWSPEKGFRAYLQDQHRSRPAID
jgi:competence protein ComEC